MRVNDRLSQFNDEDYYSGGPCPSCRLAINKETGRLKWCMGGNNTWRLRVRLMLIIPAVLLPITIIFIAICRSNTIGKISQQRNENGDNDQNRDNSDSIKETLVLATSLNYDSDQSEIEDTRDFTQERRTSYVPTDNTFNMGRQKRDVSIGDRWHTFRGNVTSDLIIWVVPENESDRRLVLERNLASDHFMNKMIRRKINFSQTVLKNSSKIRNKDDDSANKRHHLSAVNGEVSDTLIEKNTDIPDERIENSLPDYPDDEADQVYENGEIDPDDYQDGELMYGDSAGNLANQMPWHTVDSGDKNDGQQEQGESDEGEQGGIRQSINDNTWLAMEDGTSDKTSDFHAFWKGEGDLKSIREAQGAYKHYLLNKKNIGYGD